MSSISFVVEDAPEGAHTARAIGQSIVTQVETKAELHEQVRKAVRCHFDEGQAPKLIHLHFVRDELIPASQAKIPLTMSHKHHTQLLAASFKTPSPATCTGAR